MYNRRLNETIQIDTTHPLNQKQLSESEFITTQLHKRIIPYSEVQFSQLNSVRNVRDLLIEKRRERLAKLAPTDDLLEEKSPRMNFQTSHKSLSKSMNAEQFAQSLRMDKLEETDLKRGFKPFEQRMQTPHLKPLNPHFYWGYRERDKRNSSKFLSSSWVSPTKLTNRKDSKLQHSEETIYLGCKSYDNTLPGDNMRNRTYSYQKDAYFFRENFHFHKEKRLVNLPKVKSKLKNKVVYDHMVYNTKNEDDRVRADRRGKEYLLEPSQQVIIKRSIEPSKWISDVDFSQYVYSNEKRNPLERKPVLHDEPYLLK